MQELFEYLSNELDAVALETQLFEIIDLSLDAASKQDNPKYVVIPKKQAKLIGHLLEVAAEQFSNHGCNDLEKDIYKDWGKEEKLQLANKFEEYNSGGKDEVWENVIFNDSMMMRYFSDEFKK